jgi:2-oxo-4-hydroxy-4-carboxy-5-ureidoimidazoline decarboxylase
MTVLTLPELNASSHLAFVAAIGWVYEHSPWVAERAWARRPFRTLDDLVRAMQAEVDAAGREEQLALVRSHPDLGARARMSDASSAEQARVGLDRLTRADYDRLQRLNNAYRTRFGFPFLFAVKGSTSEEILAALETRSIASREAELTEALRQAHRIAELRIREAVR